MLPKGIKDRIIEILRDVPVVDHACKKADIARATYYRWMEEDKEFRNKAETAILEGKGHMNEIADSQLIVLIKEKNLPAIKHWQTHNDPNYYSKEVAALRKPSQDRQSLRWRIMDMMRYTKMRLQAKLNGEELSEENIDRYL